MGSTTNDAFLAYNVDEIDWIINAKIKSTDLSLKRNFVFGLIFQFAVKFNW